MYAEPPRQYDSSNWKASCLPRGGGPKDKSWVKGKSIRSLPCRLSSRSFFFSFFPFSPFSFISFYFSLSLTSIGEFSLRFSSKQEEISHDSSFSIHFHVDVPSIVLVPLLADARSPDSIRRSSCSFTSSRCSDDGDPMLRATGSETILPSFLPSFLPSPGKLRSRCIRDFAFAKLRKLRPLTCRRLSSTFDSVSRHSFDPTNLRVCIESIACIDAEENMLFRIWYFCAYKRAKTWRQGAG